MTAPGSPERGWLHWLPHARDPESGDRLVATNADLPESLVSRAQPGGRCGPHVVLVVDDPTLLAARRAPVRELLAADRSSAALVLADATASLPSTCDVVIEARPDGTAVLRRPGRAELGDHVIAAGASVRTARTVALALAGWHDPEQAASGAGLPSSVPLASLLQGGCVSDPDEVRRGWQAAGGDPPLRTRLGVAADGPMEVDLVPDGPHALVAGTTGAGKSELLRSLVAGLAAAPARRSSPSCSSTTRAAPRSTPVRAPARRRASSPISTSASPSGPCAASRPSSGAESSPARGRRDDLTAYRRAAPGRRRPAPRRRRRRVRHAGARSCPSSCRRSWTWRSAGRSLGVHLVLATQRPAGVVSDDIRANTNLRIALRVQDAAESVDVVGVPGRGHPAPPSSRPGGGALRPRRVRGGTDRVGQRPRGRGRGAGHGGATR